MKSSNKGNNNPHPQPPNLSRNRRYTQHPYDDTQRAGAFAIRGIDGGSQSVSSDIRDDITLLEPLRRGGGGPSTTATAAESSSTQHNPGEEEEPAAVIAHASVVDEQAEAERERLFHERTAQLDALRQEREAERLRQIELEQARLAERDRVLELEAELQRMRAASGGKGEVLTAYVEHVVPRQYGLAHEEEEEKQEVGDPVPTAHQDQQDGRHETRPRDLEALPEGVRPISVRPVDDDTTLEGFNSTGVSAVPLQMNDDHDGNGGEESNTRCCNKRHRRRSLFVAAVFLVLVAAVAAIVTVVVAGMSSGGSSSSSTKEEDPAATTSPSNSPPTPASDITQPPSSLSLSSSAPSPFSSAAMVLPTKRPAASTAAPTQRPMPLTTIVSWKQLGADLNGVAADDEFGYSIALSADGTIMAVGSRYNDANGNNSGQVRVFEYDTTAASGGGQWKQLGANLNGAAALDWFGTSVALSANGTILAVGADGNDANGELSGQVRVFEYSNDNDQWTQLGADINGEAASDWFGRSIALSSDGTILAVGSYGNDGNGDRVGVFQYGKAEGRWIQLGADLVGEAAGDDFGTSVALSEDGTILAAGGKRDDRGLYKGHARVFRYDTVRLQWQQLGADLEGKNFDEFGASVALSSSGFILAVGGPGNDADGDNSGHVRVFEYSAVSNEWKQLGGDLGGKAAGDNFGNSVALSSDGTVLVVGAIFNDDNGPYSGHARVFQYNKASEKWNQLGEDLNGKAADDWFGYTVALSADGTIVASGAIWNDDNGDDSGQVRVFAW